MPSAGKSPESFHNTPRSEGHATLYTDEDGYGLLEQQNDEPRFTKKQKIIAAVVAVLVAVIGGFWFLHGNSDDGHGSGTVNIADAEPNSELIPEGSSQNQLAQPQDVEVPTGEPSVPTEITVPNKNSGGDSSAQITPVGHLGPADAATLAPPEDISKIGWYYSSAQPGQDDAGTIVMTGHVNYGGQNGFASLFTHLAKGDTVTVKTENGEVHRYKVREDVYQVPKTQDEEYVQRTADTLQRATGPEALVLLTCGGEFDPSSPLGYQDNMLIVADPIN